MSGTRPISTLYPPTFYFVFFFVSQVEQKVLAIPNFKGYARSISSSPITPKSLLLYVRVKRLKSNVRDIECFHAWFKDY